VDTTGSSAGYGPQPVTTAPEDWRQNPYVQLEGGFLGGLALGVVPFGGVGQQLLDAGGVLPHGTPEARRGLAVGLVVGGLISLVGGLTGEVVGGVATVTGIGAAVGVPAIAVSTTLVVGGVGNIAAGIRGLMTTGSGSSGPPEKAPVAEEQGPRRPSARQRDETFDRSKDNGGVPRCTYCGKEITRQPGRPDTYETDHRVPYSRGGPTKQENLEPSCRTCNRSKGPKTPDEWGGP